MAVPIAAPPTLITNIGQTSMLAASGAINTGETILVQTPPLSAKRMTAGLIICVTYIGTCTSTAGNVSTFNLYSGTAGTTSDTKFCSSALAVAQTSGTAVPFMAMVEVTVRTVGTAATGYGMLTLINQGTTGISTTASQVIVSTMATWDTTVEATIISASYLSAATTTTSTFQEAFIQLTYV